MKWLAIFACLCVATLAAAAEKNARQAPATALVIGTVFRESGLSLGGADVALIPTPAEGKKSKLKPVRVAADSRGEFAFRIPPGPMKYKLQVSASGFQSHEQTVEIQAEERVDLSIVLKAKEK